MLKKLLPLLLVRLVTGRVAGGRVADVGAAVAALVVGPDAGGDGELLSSDDDDAR